MISVSPSSPRRLRLGDARDPAIDRDDNIAPLPRDRPQRIVIEAVPFVDAIGDVEVGPRTEQPQAEQQDRRRRHAVGVIVAVDGDPPAGANCLRAESRPLARPPAATPGRAAR